MPRPVIILEFNELCPGLMNRFIAEGHLPGFQALRDQSIAYVTDAEEEGRNLEPWVQWVTVHTGLALAEHHVHELDDARQCQAPRLWDLAAEAGQGVWICGSMNATIKSPSAKSWFIPDPWSSAVKPSPPGEFDIFCNLAWKYVQEHARDSAPWSKRDYIAFAFYMLRHGLSLRTMWEAVKQLAQDLPNKALRWRRAIILDRLQWDLFRHVWKKEMPDFSTFFLNSTAHFQHYHWRDMEPESFSNKSIAVGEYTKAAILTGYKAMDRIVQECMRMAPEAAIVMMTALSQQPLLRYEALGGKCIFKPIDPQALTDFAGVTGAYKYAPVMAEEFRMVFAGEDDAVQAERALRALSISGEPLMRIGRRNGNEVFGGCMVIAPPSPDDLVRSTLSNRNEKFGALFYQADGAKSGHHHPDGLFWIREPGAGPARVEGKLPLVDAAHMLAGIVGVEFPHVATPTVEEVRLAS